MHLPLKSVGLSALVSALLTTSALGGGFTPAPGIQNVEGDNPASKCAYTTSTTHVCQTGTKYFTTNPFGYCFSNDPNLVAGNTDQEFCIWRNQPTATSFEIINEDALGDATAHLFTNFRVPTNGADMKINVTSSAQNSLANITANNDGSFNFTQLISTSPINIGVYFPMDNIAQTQAMSIINPWHIVLGDPLGHNGVAEVEQTNAALSPNNIVLNFQHADIAGVTTQVSSSQAGAVFATGNFGFSVNPADGTHIVVNGTNCFFRTTLTNTGCEIQIGVNLATTLSNAVTNQGIPAGFNRSADANVGQALYTADATHIYVRSFFSNTAANSFSLAVGDAGGTVSAATLTGGVNSGAAYGTVALNSNPADGSTTIFNTVTCTWRLVKTGSGCELTIGADANTSAKQAVVDLTGSTNPLLTVAQYRLFSFSTLSGAIIFISYGQTGTVGNGYQLAAGTASVTLSGATLSGGAPNASANLAAVQFNGVSRAQWYSPAANMTFFTEASPVPVLDMSWVDASSTFGGAMKHKSLTVSTLPTCNTAAKGYRFDVTDANSPSWGSNVTGGGGIFTGVACDGSNWKAGL